MRACACANVCACVSFHLLTPIPCVASGRRQDGAGAARSPGAAEGRGLLDGRHVHLRPSPTRELRLPGRAHGCRRGGNTALHRDGANPHK